MTGGVLRLIVLLMLVNSGLVSAMLAVAVLRPAGAILIHIDRVARPPQVTGIFAESGLRWQENAQGVLRLAPDGCRYLAFQLNFPEGTVDLSVTHLLSGERFAHRFMTPSTLEHLEWADDQRRVALVRENRELDEQTLTIIDLERGLLKNLNAPSITASSRIRWSPDGKWLSFVGYTQENIGTIFLYHAEDETITPVLHEELSAAHSMVWSPDSRYLLAVAPTTPATLGLITPEDAHYRPLLDVRAVWGAVAWSPDSRTLAVAGQQTDEGNGAIQRLYLLNPEDGRSRAVSEMPFGTALAEWSPDSRYLPYLNAEAQRIEIYDAVDEQLWSIPVVIHGRFIARWSGDGRWLVTRMERGQVRMIDVPQQRIATADGLNVSTLVGWINNEQLVYKTLDREVKIAGESGGRWHVQQHVALTDVDGFCLSTG